MYLHAMHKNNFPFPVTHYRCCATLIKKWHRNNFKIMKIESIHILLQNGYEKHAHKEVSSEVVMFLSCVLKGHYVFCAVWSITIVQLLTEMPYYFFGCLELKILP
jgi:hypothetical protein